MTSLQQLRQTGDGPLPLILFGITCGAMVDFVLNFPSGKISLPIIFRAWEYLHRYKIGKNRN